MTTSQLDQQPLAGALVTLVDASGGAIGTESVRTDASGSYALPAVAGREAFVRASFTAGGKEFEFEAAVAKATGDLRVEVDAASTLVAAKIRSLAARGQKLLETATAAALESFAQKLLGNLGPGNLPYMAKGAKDPVPAVDQLVLDITGLKDAAALLGDDLAAPTAQWQVSTVATQEALESMNVLPAGTPPSRAGDFDVSEQGALFLPTVGTGSTPIAVARLGTDGQLSVFATLPLGMANPVRVAAASGSVYVAGIDAAAKLLRVFAGRDQLTEVASYSTNLTPLQYFDRGRLDVGKDGAIVMTGPKGEPITIPAPARTTQTVVYPTMPPIVVPTEPPIVVPTTPPIVVPTTPPIVVPTTPPIVIPTMPPLPTPMPVPGFESWASGSLEFGLAKAGDGGLFVSLADSGVIGKIVQGALQPVAGKQGERGKRSGRGAYARFEAPREIAVGSDGEMYVADVGNHQIRRLSPEGSVFLVAGSGAAGVADGAGSKATLNVPRFLRSPAAGILYFVDKDPATQKERLRKIVRGTP
ncbi:MAG: hypothetical protein FJZ01_11155 [Candidatus Sericytochromatia bacterium]|nr:hypothetical protein [Candidatus Tanganyikabacteria bacterium]